MGHLYDGATPLIPSLHQPALALDHAMDLGIDPVRLLDGLPFGPAQFERTPVLLSARQWLQLLHRVDRAVASPDTAFTLGRRLLPGHYGAASQALQRSGSLHEALETLVSHAVRLSPLLTPRLIIEDEMAMLVFTDAVGLGSQRAFVVDLTITAVAAMVQWLGATRVPWTFCFNRVAPRTPEQHEAYLGARLRFGCLVDAMLVPRGELERPWPAAREPGALMAKKAASRAALHEAGPMRGVLAAVHDRLLSSLSQGPTLDDCAAALGTSAATLKRWLAGEGTHFQAELDLVRSHVALWHFGFRHADNAEVARVLGFADVPNFRRSFKRWTGQTPQGLRLALFAPP
jgi:AraC-like DNA-binding protein